MPGVNTLVLVGGGWIVWCEFWRKRGQERAFSASRWRALGLSVFFWPGPLGIGEALQAYLQSTDTSLSYAAHHHLGLASAWPAADKCVHASVYTIEIVVGGLVEVAGGVGKSG